MGIFVFLLWTFGAVVGALIVRVLFLRGWFILEMEKYTEYGTMKKGSIDEDAVSMYSVLCLFWPFYLFVWWVVRPLLKLCVHLIDNKICRPASKLNVKESIKKALED